MARKKSRQPSPRARGEEHPPAAPSPNVRPPIRWRELILGQAASMAMRPFLVMIAGFMLLFGGIFLAVAWQVGPEPMIDAAQYKTFTVHTNGRIVESWLAMEFDPADMGQKRRWFAFAKVAPCAVVEYAGDWDAPRRRAFCGNQVKFREDLDLNMWDTLMPGVPFAWQRDASGFAIGEIRLSKTARDWLATQPPYSTFMLSKPPPSTALGALREQLDRPLDTAALSWATPYPEFPLAFDPKNPDQPMPAKFVKDKQEGLWIGGFVFTAIFGVIGVVVWRLGIGFLFGSQPNVVLWVLTIAPLLALPWWGDALPKMLRHANRDWASVGTDMLDDLSRVTRLLASEPADATQASGERIALPVSEGLYADTFGRIHFVRPEPAPTTPDLAQAALRAQASAYVQKLDAATQAALFARLEKDTKAGRERAAPVFTTAAEDVLRAANTGPDARAAARRFLLYGMQYNLWDVDAMDKRAAKGS